MKDATKWRAAILVVALLAFLTLAAGGSSRTPNSVVGTWNATVILYCGSSQGGGEACSVVGGRPIVSYAGWFDARSDASGRFTFRAGSIITGDGPAGACGPAVLRRPVGRPCLMTEHGTGVIRGQSHGPRTFWLANEVVTFHGTASRALVRDPLGARAYPRNSGIPAVPGSYNTNEWRRLFHVPATRADKGALVRLLVAFDPAPVPANGRRSVAGLVPGVLSAHSSLLPAPRAASTPQVASR